MVIFHSYVSLPEGIINLNILESSKISNIQHPDPHHPTGMAPPSAPSQAPPARGQPRPPRWLGTLRASIHPGCRPRSVGPRSRYLKEGMEAVWKEAEGEKTMELSYIISYIYIYMCVCLYDFICMYLKLNRLTSRTQSPPPIPGHFLGSPCLGFFLGGIPMESPSSCLPAAGTALWLQELRELTSKVTQEKHQSAENALEMKGKYADSMWHVSRVNSM